MSSSAKKEGLIETTVEITQEPGLNIVLPVARSKGLNRSLKEGGVGYMGIGSDQCFVLIRTKISQFQTGYILLFFDSIPISHPVLHNVMHNYNQNMRYILFGKGY